MEQALEHPWFNNPRVPLGEDVDSNQETETEEEAESVEEEEEEVQRSSSVAPPIQAIPEESELGEEDAGSSLEDVAGLSLDQSTSSSRRSSQGWIEY